MFRNPSSSSEQPNPVVPMVNLQKEESQLRASAIRARKSQQAVLIGLVANVFLAGLKTTIGILGRSPALLAEGINSTSDVAYYLVVWVFVRLSGKPADEEHPYGHSQLESIASLIVGSFILTTGIAVFWDAVNNVYDLVSGTVISSGAALAALWVAALTIGIKIFLLKYTRQLGEQTGNPAVVALVYDHRNDLLSASAAFIGIYLGRQGLPWVDPLVGALVALLILRTGVEILRQSSAELMDAVPSRDLYRQISALLSEEPDVKSVEQVHAHRFGPYLVVNLTIGVEGELTVAAGDCISTQVENLLYERFELVRQVYVHYHPVTSVEPCEPLAITRMLSNVSKKRAN